MVHDGDDAEDLMIETFGKAFRRLKQYSPQFAFSTWLFKIASNGAIDFITKKAHQGPQPGQGLYGFGGRHHGNPGGGRRLDPEQSLEKQQRVNRMREVVAQLKPRYRRLVELRYFEEYSYDEISKELNLPLGTVKAQLFRARDILAAGVLEIDREQFSTVAATEQDFRAVDAALDALQREAHRLRHPRRSSMTASAINSPGLAVPSGMRASTSFPARTSTSSSPGTCCTTCHRPGAAPGIRRAHPRRGHRAVSPASRSPFVFPEVNFTLCDSIGKKIEVVNAVSQNLVWATFTARGAGRRASRTASFRLRRSAVP